MFDVARGHSIDFECYDDQSYEDIVAAGGQPFTCGSQTSAFAFFLLFQVIVSQVFLNLFVAIIIDSFLVQTDLSSSPVKKDNV